MTIPRSIILAVEDELSGAVLQKLVLLSKRSFEIRVNIAKGYGRLKKGMNKYREASRIHPHIVLTDLDRCPCPPQLIDNWNANRLPPQLLFRIAVREVEAWLMADRDGIAEFLKINVNKIPYEPETLEDPKQTLVNLARKSRSRKLSQELVPEAGSSASIGPLYNPHFINFVSEHWNVEQACQHAPHLAKTLRRISTFLLE